MTAWSGRTPRTVRRWSGAFAAGGIGGPADAPRPGRPAVADAACLEALAEAARTPPRRLLGSGFDAWTSERLRAYLARTTGVGMAPGWPRVLLARRRFACGRPERTPARPRDPEEAAACEEELARAQKKWRPSPGATGCTTKTRLAWRPTRTSGGGAGTGRASSPHCPRRAPTAG